MADEKIEVGYRQLGEKLGIDYHHKFLLYTDKTGHQYTISGWMDEENTTEKLPNGNIRVLVNAPYDGRNPDHHDFSIRNQSQKQYRETIIEAPDLSTQWGEMIKNAQSKDNIYPYDIMNQNSNAFADSVLRDVGLPEPKLDGLAIGNHLAPSSGHKLNRNIAPPKSQRDLGLSDIGDALSLDDTNSQNPLTQPIAVNASSQEVTSYLFAALMSDDDDLRYAAIDSALQTNVAQESAQQAQQAVIAYDNQQALIEQQNQQINNPVRVMRM